MTDALRLDGVSVSYGGLRAVDDVSFTADRGEVFGLIGPNGAGKSTLLNVMNGLLAPTSGSVHLDGRDVTALGADRRARLGMARTFQRLEVFGVLTVRDNVLVAHEIRRRWFRGADSPVDDVDDLLARVGLTDFADHPAGVISTGHARLLELARALAIGPRVLLLDEPASGLDEGETGRLGSVLTELADQGMCVVLVEHDMSLVMQVSHRIAVLDTGRLLCVDRPAVVRAEPAVQAAYLGAPA